MVGKVGVVYESEELAVCVYVRACGKFVLMLNSEVSDNKKKPLVLRIRRENSVKIGAQGTQLRR